MPVVFIKSTSIANGDASPRVLNGGRLAGGEMREHIGVVPVANADSIASVYRVARIRSSDRVTMVKHYNDAITGAAMDVGIYRTAADGGAVVSVAFFASAVAIATAITTGTEIQHESGTYTVANADKPLWQALGLASDPGIMYDVAATLTAAATATGNLAIKVAVVNEG